MAQLFRKFLDNLLKRKSVSFFAVSLTSVLLFQILGLFFVLYSEVVLNYLTPSISYPQKAILANPYTICIEEGDRLVYDLEVRYGGFVSQDNPTIVKFYKNLFYKINDKYIPIATVKSGLNHIIRQEPVILNITPSVDIRANTDVPDDYEWREGQYIFRDAAKNLSPGDGVDAYSVYFENKCD